MSSQKGKAVKCDESGSVLKKVEQVRKQCNEC